MSILSQFTLAGEGGAFVNLPRANDLSREGCWLKLPEGDGGWGGLGTLEAMLTRDDGPIPSLKDREGYYGERHFDYWMSGLLDVMKIVAAARRHGMELGEGKQRMLEIGCATGRVIRHFGYQFGEGGMEAYGCDVNARHVEWMRQFVPPVACFQNTVYPHLPLEDHSLDCVCAFSVFTHIHELELAWLLELRRVLRPGGIAYLSVHTEHTWSRLSPDMGVYHMMKECAPLMPEIDVSDEAFKRPMPMERLVFDLKSRDVYNTNVFHSRDYLHKTWGRFMEVCEIMDKASGYQDVVVLRKR